jgi:hypothetical protein
MGLPFKTQQDWSLGQRCQEVSGSQKCRRSLTIGRSVFRKAHLRQLRLRGDKKPEAGDGFDGTGDVRNTMKYQHHDHLEPVRNAIDQRNLERHNSRHSPVAVQ